jgi:hypothetical protein
VATVGAARADREVFADRLAAEDLLLLRLSDRGACIQDASQRPYLLLET